MAPGRSFDAVNNTVTDESDILFELFGCNGGETVNIRNDKYSSGPFALQYSTGVKGAVGGPITWRKVQIKPL